MFDYLGGHVPLCLGKPEYFDSADDASSNTYVQRVLWREGRELCTTCPVRDACLDAALWEEATTPGRGRHYRYGLRAGMGPGQREAEHHRRGMSYLCTRCRDAPRLTHGDLCQSCADTENARAQRARRIAAAADVYNPELYVA